MRKADNRWGASDTTGGVAGTLLASREVVVEETSLGTWRRFVYPAGSMFAEFRSNAEVLGYPLIHYTAGVDPALGRRIVARGFIAVGRRAVGFVAIGQLALGVLAIGQAAVGMGALGQVAGGIWTVGQLSIGYMFALGQIAVGSVAIGQMALGGMAMGQMAAGRHAWSSETSDPEAVSYFKALLKSVTSFIGV
jgi:hypothetical protein